MKKVLKSLKFWVLGVIVFLLFQDFIEKLFADKIIKPILSKAQWSYLLDAVLVLIIIFGLYLFIFPKLKKGYYVKFQHVISSIIILAIYLFYRLNCSFDFLSTKTIKVIKYFDVLFLLFTIPILFYVGRIFKRKKNNLIRNEWFLDDVEINSPEQDLLSRSNIAKNVFNQIITSSSKKSFAFGITGEWGSGKSSFIELIKSNFDNRKNDYVLIDLNPWININLNSIIQDFFNSIESELRKESLDISKDIRKYGESVVSVDDSGVIDSALKNLNIIQQKSLTEEFNELNDLLITLNKKVIVFIDDFDRLQATEIMEVLKLIRNTAGFKNFIYIVAFDKQYLIESLKNINIPIAEKYSEKIFVREVKLLPLTNSQKYSFLKKNLLEKFPERTTEIEGILEEQFSIFYSKNNKSFFDPLRHIRDMKRFLNQFYTNYPQIKDEVMFIDFFVLQLLKYKFYDVYILLYNSRSDFLTTKKGYQGGNVQNELTLIESKNKQVTKSIRHDDFRDSKLKDFLSSSNLYNEDELDSIGRLMNILFPEYKSMIGDLSICHTINYYKYFREELDENNLSKVEFNSAFAQPLYELKNHILKWEEEDKLNDVRFFYYAMDFKTFKDREEYEKYVETAFLIGSLKKHKLNPYEGFDVSILFYITIEQSEEVIERYYSGNTEEFRTFIFDILNRDGETIDYKLEFCNHADEHLYSDNKAIKKDEIRSYIIKYFKEYVQTIDELDDKFWMLFHCCEFKNYTQSGNRYSEKMEYHPEAIQIFKEFMAKDLDNFLVVFVKTPPFYNKRNINDSYISVSQQIPKFFKTHSNFIKFLRSKKLRSNLVKPSLFVDEFLNFMEELEKISPDFSKGINDFNFTFQPVLDKLNERSNRGN